MDLSQISPSRLQALKVSNLKDITLYNELIEKNQYTLKEYGIVEYPNCIEIYKECLQMALDVQKSLTKI